MPEETRTELDSLITQSTAKDVYVSESTSQETQENLANQRYKEETERLKANQKTRAWLLPVLSVVSVAWLFFTGVIVWRLGHQCYLFDLSDSVAIAFLTTSLGTVLALWGIALYFFFPNK
jgi:hypothetical protein